ncbi:MAG: NADH dehydrogenase [marine actinobacterium MedAcidi-G2A]|nr:MAG: NADH dehydrogenase [marine actinobacterium MedAcidi-G2A]MBA4810316.1 nitroreductase [Acidimicrobiales bacterium]|tara:strand:+ start:17060 stop:17710 length:651 start_codon:yes stop_codon:yes gene_type:complete
MEVSQAVMQRKSIRGFLPTPVEDELLSSLLDKAARAPSGGNVQPWRIYVINDNRMSDFKSHINEFPLEEPEYPIYPPKLQEPYRTNRYELGEEMYSLLGIPRDDKPARLANMSKNYDFFGAPAAFFCFVDRSMGSAQWSDLGMFLQTFMLLAEESGLGTCAQEAWAMHQKAVSMFVKSPVNEMLFCGMSIGYPDWKQPVNSLESKRMPLNQWCTWA